MLALLANCVFAPCPAAHLTNVSTPPNFDRSWDATLGAAAVTIELKPPADSSRQVSFNAAFEEEGNPRPRDRGLVA